MTVLNNLLASGTIGSVLGGILGSEPTSTPETSSLLYDWDFSDASTQSRSGNDLIHIDDKVSAVRAVTSTTAKPQMGTRTINGLGVADLSKTERMTTGVVLNHGFTVSAVVQIDVIGTANVFSGTTSRCALQFSSFGERLTLNGGASAFVNSFPQVSQNIIVAVFDAGGAGYKLYNNGSELTLSGALTGSTSNADELCLFNDTVSLGDTRGVDGVVGQLRFFDSILTPAEIADEFTLLNTKWAIY